MGKSLYREYRSKSFDEIIGQDHITTTLKNSLKSDSVAHAYILSGPRGVGKTSVARILAYAVNDMEYAGESTNLDIIEIDAASNRRIDEIREIRERVSIAPVAGKYKVYIIDEVHMLTREAFNALLKTLEEPPSHVIFILATTEIHKVPETILSRCIKLNFKPINQEVLESHLKTIASAENIDISDNAISIIAKHGRGSFRDAISILDQVKNSSNKIDYQQVNLMLGLAEEDIIDKLLDYVLSQNLSGISDTLNMSYISGINVGSLATQISERFRKMIISNDERIKKQDLLNTLHELLSVPGSYSPNIALELCLHQLALNFPKISIPKAKIEQKNNIENKQDSSNNALHEPKKSSDENSITTEDEENDKVQNISALDNSDTTELWKQVLDTLKSKHNTLYGIARMASLDRKDNNLYITFGFKFHYNQMNNAKNKQILNDILSKISNSEVSITLNPPKSSENLPSSDNSTDLKTISNIFGNTEVLES